MPQNDQILPKIGIFGQLCALLVSRLVVVARGLYLARHLFTLLYCTEHIRSKSLVTVVMTLTIILMMVKKEDGLMLIDDTVVSGHMYFFDISITV